MHQQFSSLTNKYEQSTLDQQDRDGRYSSIIKLKKSLENIDLLISISEDAAQTQELQEMKKSVEEALADQTSQLKQLQSNAKTFPLSMETLKDDDVGKLTKVFIQADRKWKNAEVVKVDVEQQEAVVMLYGKGIRDQKDELKTEIKMPAYFLKVLKAPDSSLFQEGGLCKAIYSGDGEFYPCTIEKIDGQGYHVRYKKYNSKEIVKLIRLRPMQQYKNDKEEPKFEDLTELKIPEKLKILPNDPQNVKKSKKVKVKALKFAFKNAQVEQYNKEKQSKWQSFNSSGLKYGHFQTKAELEMMNQSKQTRQAQAQQKKQRIWGNK